jgi:hypothetical protein
MSARRGIFELYRFQHPGGGSKDWAIALVNGDGGGIDVRYGATGTTLRGGRVKSRYTDNHAELNRRVSEKLREGYQRVGAIVVYEDGRFESATAGREEPEPKAQPDAEDKVFFEIRATVASAIAGFLATCHKACGKLREAGVTGVDVKQTQDAVVFTIGQWSFEVADSASINPNALLRSNRTGGGRIKAEEGVYPFLFLTYLKRNTPREFEVNLAWKDGIEVTDRLHHEAGVLAMFGTTFDSIRSVAVALGLAEEKIDLAAVGSDASLYF